MLRAALFFASILAAAAAPASHVLHEKRSADSNVFNLERRRVDYEAIIPIRIALKQSNLDSGYDRLMDVSHPSSDNYGKHLSAEEVHSIFAPAEESIKAVKDWLLSGGVQTESIMDYENRGWIAVDLPAGHAETLLHTEYYESDHSDGVRIGSDSYYLPKHVAEHVDFIKPGVKLSPPLKKRTIERRKANALNSGYWRKPPHFRPPHLPGYHMPPAAHGLPPDLQNCGVNITPTCIKALYNIPDAKYSDPANVQGIYETGDAFAQADLDLFFKNFAPNVPQGTSPTVDSVDGGLAPVPAGSVLNTGESDIDIDLSYALIYPQQVTVYQVDDIPNAVLGEFNKAGFLNTFLDAVDGSYCNYSAYGITGDSPTIDATYPDTAPGGYTGQRQCGVYKLTRVLTISYGEAEVNFPKAYVQRQCNEIMKLGLQGHSIFVSSGDYGVASFPKADGDPFGCLSSPGHNGTIYNPDYPSGCPYITSVGGTRLYANQTIRDRESAMQVNLTALNPSLGAPYGFFASGGGFSNIFTPPSYQAAAVKGYLQRHNPGLPSYAVNADETNIGENGGVYNRLGRGYPDVSANGVNLLFYNNLTLFKSYGTSLSSPIFASIITLINEERTARGKGPVGFVNPVLYARK